MSQSNNLTSLLTYLRYIAVLTITIAVYITLTPANTSAQSFNPGHIMDDNVMTDYRSMSANDIQNFLNSKVPHCDLNGEKSSEYGGGTRAQYAASRGVSPPFTCMRHYSQNGKSAAQIIYDAAQAFRINPKVILVLLQKEQGLITDDWPWPIQYRSATGYGCPDTAPCDSEYYGLTNQVRWAARMFRAILDNSPTWYAPYTVGQNRIYWNPDTGRCGSSTVNIENRTTAALYSYTPYRPNQAALNAGYGTGDSCSSYGNRNFWLYFKDWFGDPAPSKTVKVNIVRFDSTTDKTGEQAQFGYRLSTRPSGSVRIPVSVNSPSNIKITSGSSVTIHPDNWNKPENNKVTVVGLNNPNQEGNRQHWIRSGSPVSSDSRFSSLTGNQVGHIPLVNQDVSSTTGVYRLYSSTLGKHYYTADMIEVNQRVQEGWQNEGRKFNVCQAGEQTIYRLKKNDDYRLTLEKSDTLKSALKDGFKVNSISFATSASYRGGMIPVYWNYKASSGNSIYTLNPEEGVSAGYTQKGIGFYVCSPDTTPVYRLYNSRNPNHFYTTSSAERDSAIRNGYRYEKLGFYVCKNGTRPIYRLYSESRVNHFYTASADERDRVQQNDYRYEGVAFATCPNDTRSVYRLYSSASKNHFYTTYGSERDSAIQGGYKFEGEAFNAR